MISDDHFSAAPRTIGLIKQQSRGLRIIIQLEHPRIPVHGGK
jgi:hypothetical protein